MATEQDTSTPDATLRPQTPAARQRNPGASQARTPEERERLREESRARRKARADGRVIAPEPGHGEISLHRLAEPPAEAPAQPPPPITKPARPEVIPTQPPAATPEPPVATREPPVATPEPPAATREPAPSTTTAPPPATPAGGRTASPKPTPAVDLRPPVDDPDASAPRAGGTAAPRPRAPRADEAAAPRPRARGAAAPRPRLAARGAWERFVQAVRDRAAFSRGATASAAGAGAPPARPSLPSLPSLPDLPSTRRERVTVLIALASAFGIVIALASALGAGGLGGGGGFRVEAGAPAVAPGGWLTLTGADAPDHAKLILESRRRGENWHSFTTGQAGGGGDFDVKGRLLERPGRVQLRARVPGGAASDPIAITVRPLRLAAVGDINLDGAPPDAWGSVGRALKRADISFGNLESSVSKRGTAYAKEYNFRADPKALAALAKRSGIDVLNLANNHTGDYGPKALLDTIGVLERDGIAGVGAGSNLRRALQPHIVSRLGLRVAFVGFSEIAPIEFTAGADRPGTAWANPSEIAAAVRAARRRADIVIATFHWGIERQTLETARQRELADYAIRAGAQVVIGAHPHTLQPVRRQGGAIVAYSLGNFVFPDARSPETTTTGILQLGLTADGVARAKWRSASIRHGRPLLAKGKPKRLPLRNSLRMQAGVNLPEL